MDQLLVDIVCEWLDDHLLDYDFGEVGTKNRLLEDLSNYLLSYNIYDIRYNRKNL